MVKRKHFHYERLFRQRNFGIFIVYWSGSELSLKNHFAFFFGKILLSPLSKILDSANILAFCPRNFYERGTAMDGRAYHNF